MGQPIHRIPPVRIDPQRRAADRALLLTRIAVGLAHEGKNPLHNMVLHLQLVAEKLKEPEGPSSDVDKHLTALRDGIGRVDQLLRAFADFAAPDHLPCDLAAATQRAAQLFAYDARRAGVQVQVSVAGPATLLAASDGRVFGDLVAHALVACIESAREGGKVQLVVRDGAARVRLEATADGGYGGREQALPHLDAARLLAAEAACELSIESPPAGGVRLSLSFSEPR